MSWRGVEPIHVLVITVLHCKQEEDDKSYFYRIICRENGPLCSSSGMLHISVYVIDGRES